MPNYAPFAPFMTILRSMNVCSIDSRAGYGGETLIRMLGSTGLLVSSLWKALKYKRGSLRLIANSNVIAAMMSET